MRARVQVQVRLRVEEEEEDFSEVYTRDVLVEISLLRHQYPSRVVRVPERREACFDLLLR